MQCRKGYDIIVCQSAAGFYRGTKTEFGEPNCRLTGYAGTKEQAGRLPFTREFGCINEFCNGHKSCIPPD